MPRVRALIFDMDGVIVDSNPWHRLAWDEYTRGLGVTMTDAMQERMYGKRNAELIREFFGQHLGDAEVSAHGAAKEKLYREIMKPYLKDALVPGIREFIERHRDLALAVATNAEPPNVDFVLNGTGLGRFFTAIVNGHEVANPKPHPEIYLRIANTLDLEPEECVVFEDSHTGVEAARAAGMWVIGVTTTHDDLEGVSLSVRNFRDHSLEQWLVLH